MAWEVNLHTEFDLFIIKEVINICVGHLCTKWFLRLRHCRIRLCTLLPLLLVGYLLEFLVELGQEGLLERTQVNHSIFGVEKVLVSGQFLPLVIRDDHLVVLVQLQDHLMLGLSTEVKDHFDTGRL